MHVIGQGVGALGMPGIDRDGGDLLLLWAAVHFDLPRPRQRGPLKIRAEQPPPSAAPRWVGEPGLSSLVWEAPIAFARATTEVHVRADACAPAGTLARELAVGVRVGECLQRAVVLGERRWISATEFDGPLPFDRLPLIWEHAFGGRSAIDDRKVEMRNPIGTGMYANRSEAIGQRLPFIEHPSQRIRSIADRPEPVGFLPRGTGWQPRLALAGTYDQAWIEDRAPLWPNDFDEAFFLAAPEALVSPARLVGGEACALVGMHPEGDIVFELPRVRVHARTHFRRRDDVRELGLDIVTIDALASTLTLVFRATLPAHRELGEHEVSLVERS